MPNREVHWHEGMCLRQHHFLTEHRQLIGLMQIDNKCTLRHNWGLLSTQNLAGYETVPIARIEKSERAVATPQLDATYIPPLLACDAWQDLNVGILQEIYDRVGRKIERLASQATTQGLSLESLSPD